MKLYTKRGDDGATDLFGGQRVNKDSLRVVAFGTVDELNSAIGLVLTACPHEEFKKVLKAVQHRLFEIGAELAAFRAGGSDDKSHRAAIGRLGPEPIEDLERQIDAFCEPLAPMKHFILPGGTELSARLHLARTVCRRAERCCVALKRVEPVSHYLVIYLNRFSDLLFAMARRANQLAGVDDVPWKKGSSAETVS